jgi:hypothetical protein
MPETMSPKICIVFNGGAAGDFLTGLLHQQIVDSHYRLIVDDNGKVINEVSSVFKDNCKQFYYQDYVDGIFQENFFSDVVNTHYCSTELLRLFPECQFYYIDDTKSSVCIFDIYFQKFKWEF